MDGKWSIAWRVHDAQFWGVPQRRRRIALVCDFGGHTAPEILFERKGLRGDTAEGRTAREGIAGDAESSIDKTIFCLQGNVIDRPDTANCNDRGWRENVSYTLNTIDRPAVCAGMRCLTPWDSQSQRVYDENGVSPTLSSRENSGLNREAVLCAGFKLGNGERSRSIGYEEELSPTLNAECGGNKPAVMSVAYGIGNGQAHEAMTMAQEVSQTLNTMHDKQAILYQPKSAMEENWTASETKNALRAGESKVSHAVLCEDVSQQAWEEATGHPTESAGGYDRVAEGEGNCKKLRGIYNDKFQPIAFAQNQRDEVRDLKDKAGALAAEPGMKQQNFVAHPMTMQAIGEYKDCDVASSCKMRNYKDATDLVCEPVFERTIRWIVRRLTPMECERLQGYPDGWTDIGEWTDSKGKKHQTSDTSRYKALGNSIALPFWYWMMQNMAEYLPEKPTLGSLFDGIGGFPLCWERIHGKGTARWASEIEEFPMAVTKKRFGEG